MPKIEEANVVRSALWAAYGDAIGFPTELISASEFHRRNSLDQIHQPIAWTRRVGGMFGPDVDFPVGTYSDDTQLRLSTSRAINGAGFFDVESFAKIELPVWLNYALGAGRGSKAAAQSLASRDTSWSFNFFSSGNSRYWDGGGNGAAMRIHPHVWQRHSGAWRDFLPDVIRNSICTHGHPRALVGAVIHAGMLHETMKIGGGVHPSDWAGLGEAIGFAALEMLESDPELPLVWIPAWERNSKLNLRDSWVAAVSEWIQASAFAAKACESTSGASDEIYGSVLRELNAFAPAERGSGLKTPLFSSVLAWLYRNQPPEAALATAANVFGSDTDTIATMAGALIGVTAPHEPQVALQDEGYIQGEAARLFRIGLQIKENGFKYPDLLGWNPPKSQSDAWISDAEGVRLAGLGAIRHFGPTYKPKKGMDLVWQWAELDFGQTVLVKRRGAQDRGTRNNSVSIDGAFQSDRKSDAVRSKMAHQKDLAHEQASLLSDEVQLSIGKVSGPIPDQQGREIVAINLDALTQKCIRGGFDPAEIGHAFLSLFDGPDGIERAIAFAAIIAKAKMARSSK